MLVGLVGQVSTTKGVRGLSKLQREGHTKGNINQLSLHQSECPAQLSAQQSDLKEPDIHQSLVRQNIKIVDDIAAA